MAMALQPLVSSRKGSIEMIDEYFYAIIKNIMIFIDIIGWHALM